MTWPGSLPFSLKYAVSGTLNHISPLSSTYAMSVCPSPHANAPSAPDVFVWESPPT